MLWINYPPIQQLFAGNDIPVYQNGDFSNKELKDDFRQATSIKMIRKFRKCSVQYVPISFVSPDAGQKWKIGASDPYHVTQNYSLYMFSCLQRHVFYGYSSSSWKRRVSLHVSLVTREWTGPQGNISKDWAQNDHANSKCNSSHKTANW